MIALFYKLLNKDVPYYARYPVWLILYKPIRKFINVTIIPNIPFSKIRVSSYRLLGYKIGKDVFIGMKCYLDDMEPSKTIIEDNVVISYGCYFAVHGRRQSHTPIIIRKNSYIGMRSTLISGKKGIEIGEGAIIGACSLVNKSIPAGTTAVGIPVRIIKEAAVSE